MKRTSISTTMMTAFWALLLSLFSTVASASEYVTYLHTDVQGSPLVATDEQGAVVWREDYEPWGARQVKDTASATASRGSEVWYTGKEEEAALGMYYYGARWYVPEVGQFTGIDPAGVTLENPRSFNRYAYANNNPIRYVDPNGESPLDVGFLLYDIGKFGVAVYSGAGVGAAAVDVGMSVLGVLSPVPGTGQMIKAARTADKLNDGRKAVDQAADANRALQSAHDTEKKTEVVYRWMSKGELKATEETGLLRGGREGTHYVTDAANTNAQRARQRLALEKTPEVRVKLEVAAGKFSKPSKVEPMFNMPGGGRERTSSGDVAVKILGVD